MFLKTLILVFSMYSKIPLPNINWDKAYFKYIFCFFPVVGLFLGILIYSFGNFLFYIGVGKIMFSAVMSAVPIIFTGGIHMDGFLDTMDGINSYADKEKRLEILKDSNSGAFAIIGGIVYFLLMFGFWSEIKKEQLFFVAVGYVFSRILSGLSVVCFKTAAKSGLVFMFSENSEKIIVRNFLMALLIFISAFLFFINIFYATAVIAASLFSFVYHYYNCYKNFGGITGDLAGYFLQICELAVIGFIVISGRLFF